MSAGLVPSEDCEGDSGPASLPASGGLLALLGVLGLKKHHPELCFDVHVCVCLCLNVPFFIRVQIMLD